jgi:hypothetical protein
MDQSPAKARGFGILFCLLTFGRLLTQTGWASDLERKFSLELTYERNDLIFKLKPFDYTYLTRTQRVDFLAGKRFKTGWGDLRAFAYLKIDNHNQRWLGTRVDFGRKALRERLNLDLELRFFQGLNGKSASHFYVIPSAYYTLDKKGRFTIGPSGYGKKVFGEKPFFYVGLDGLIKLTGYLSTLVSYSRDTYGSGDMVWWILYLKF